MNLEQLNKAERQLTFTIKLLTGAIASILLGSCVSQPTVKPNGGQPKTTTQTPQVITPTQTPVSTQNSHTIINTGQMRPTQPQYQTPTQAGQTQVGQRPIGQGQPATPIYQTSPTIPSTAQGTISSTAQGVHYGSFGEWQQDFLRRSGTAGQLVSGASYTQSAVRQDNNQAEFVAPIWQYLDNRTTASMVSQGQQKRRANLPLFDRNEAQYGVPASIVTAIWGIETGYGGNMGNMDLVNSLSTLAYDGRRRAWAEGELLAMNQLIANGDVYPSQLKGSYAGGMGHTQFIPSTWLRQGVDGDGDGRKNPFAMADAVTSTASYLANSGWVRNLPAYFEVSLPSNFNYQYIGQKLSLDQWRALGLNAFSDTLAGNALAELWLPAGINGPALLTTQNFEVIKVYNNSSNYALAVAVLAQKLNGRAGIEVGFPRHERMLSKSQIQRLQQNLTAQGFDTGGADGIAGTNTRRAFARWQAVNGRIPDGFISQSSAGQLVY